MENQQQRRRKQEKPRHLNNQDGDDDETGGGNAVASVDEDRTGEVTIDEDNLLCKSCHVRMPTKSDLNDHLNSCHYLHTASMQVSWEHFRTQNRPPVINLMKKKFSFVQSNSCSDNNSKSEENHRRNETDPTIATRSCEETKEMEASGAKKMKMSEQDEDSEDDQQVHRRETYLQTPSMNFHQLNMLLIHVQQHQIIHWQVLDAIRKKVIEDKMPQNSEVFNDLTSLFLRHQKEIAHISASNQLAVGFLGRGDQCKPPPQDPHVLHYQNLYNSMMFKHQAEDLRNGIIPREVQSSDKMGDSDIQRSSDDQSPRDIHQIDKQAEDDVDDDVDDDDDDDDDMMEDESLLKCSICEDSFPTKENLRLHFQEHMDQNIHMDQIARDPDIEPIKSSIHEEINENHGPMRRDHLIDDEQNQVKEKYSDPKHFSERLANVQYLYPDNKPQETFSHILPSESLSSKREFVYDIKNDDNSFKENDFKSPLVALSSMSSALNFNKTPMSLMFPGEGSLSSQAYQTFRYNTPTSLMKSAIMAPNGHDDPLEQYMEIQVTENPKMEELIKEGESKVTDPNECGICHRVLSCRSALQMHYRTHTGERPYKCKLCSRTFTTKGNLKTHMSVHRGKPLQRQLHKCPICSREFSNPLVLQQHFRSHTSNHQKAFSSLFPGMIPGMFMPPISPFFSYPINPNPYFNPLFSSQFAMKNFPNIRKVFQEQRTSQSKPIETQISNFQNNGIIHENSKDFHEGKQDMKLQDDKMDSSKVENGNCENMSDKSSDESYISNEDQKEQNIFQNEEIKKSSFNSVLYSEENHLSTESKLSYMSPLVALADRVNALNHHFAFSESPRQQRDAVSQMDTPRNVPDDFNKSVLLRTPTSLNTSLPNSFLSSPLFLKASEAKSGLSDSQANLAGNGKASAACPICGKMFSCKSAVDIHMRSHTKERPFRCEYCDRAFTTKGNLKQHVGTNHHAIARVSEQTNQQLGLRTANWMSDSSSSQSGSPFNNSTAIVSNHMISSPNVKQEITTCENQSDLKSKEQGSSSSEPGKQNPNGARYFCTICEKPFSSTSALQIHSRTHTGDRPFVCPTCNKAFTTKGNLKVHMGTHAWNKVPSRRGRRMSVEPLGPQFNAVLSKDQVINPSIMASFHQKMNCVDRFPSFSLIGLPNPNLFQSKLSEHNLNQGFPSKLPLMASLQGQSFCYPSYARNYDFLKSPTSKLTLPQEVSVKTEKLDNETELDLSIKKPSPPVSSTPSKPMMLLREGTDWSNDVKPHHLALNCR